MVFQSNYCQDHWAPFATSITTSVVAAILTLVTVPGNLLICWAVIRNPTGELKTSFNYLVVNLAISDLIIGLITDPVFVDFHVKEALMVKELMSVQWVVHVSYFFTSTVSVLSIVALAVNRYQAVRSYRLHRAQHSISRTIKVSVSLWILSLSLPLLYRVVGFFRLAFIFANAAVVVTSIVLVFVYFRVCHFLKRHRKTSAHIQSSELEREKQVQREQKATNSLLMIAVAFILCSFPSCVMVYIINLCHTCNCFLIHWLRDLQFLFILINSASNQFLYAFRMRSFKRAFMTISAIAWLVDKFGRQELSLNYPTPQQSQSDSTPSQELKVSAPGAMQRESKL